MSKRKYFWWYEPDKMGTWIQKPNTAIHQEAMMLPGIYAYITHFEQYRKPYSLQVVVRNGKENDYLCKRIFGNHFFDEFFETIDEAREKAESLINLNKDRAKVNIDEYNEICKTDFLF